MSDVGVASGARNGTQQVTPVHVVLLVVNCRLEGELIVVLNNFFFFNGFLVASWR